MGSAESYSLIKQWGSRGSGNGQFEFPWSLALDSSNNVYVSDLANQRIQKFDAAGNFITLWSIGGYNHATGVATDTSNNVYHVYAQSSPISYVEKYTSNGDLIKSWAIPNPAGPNVNDVQTAIAVDSSNNVYASNNDTIFKFTSDGTLIKSWGSSGKRIGQFNQIVGLATDSLNNVYVTDKYNGRVEKFTSDGDFIKAWNCCNAEPQGIATDKSNNVYVTVYNDGGIFKFTSDGDLITSWPRHPHMALQSTLLGLYTCPADWIIFMYMHQHQVLHKLELPPQQMLMEMQYKMVVQQFRHLSHSKLQPLQVPTL